MDGVLPDKKEKRFDSITLLAISSQPGSDGTGLADNWE